MNTTPAKNSRKDGIVTTIALLVVVIGTATGNAIAMFVMALLALIVIAIFDRQKLGRHFWPLMSVVAAIAFALSFALSWH